MTRSRQGGDGAAVRNGKRLRLQPVHFIGFWEIFPHNPIKYGPPGPDRVSVKPVESR